MTKRSYSFVGAVVSLAMVMLLVVASASLGDTCNGGINVIREDTKARFSAYGWWETYDTTNDGLFDTWFFINTSNDFWRFGVKHMTTPPHWTAVNAVGVRVTLGGYHWDGPCQIDVDPNLLDEITTKPRQNIPFAQMGGTRFATTYGGKDHPTTTPAVHKDEYEFDAVVSSYQAVPPETRNKLGGIWDIRARHIAEPCAAPWSPLDRGFGSSIGSGSVAVFDAETGVLSLGVLGIDILDAVGGLSGGIDPAYVGDPFLSGVFSITDMHYIGQEPDGRHRFSGCQVTVTDPLGNFNFEGNFKEYLIDSTVMGAEVTSYAHDDSLFIVDINDAAEGGSPFLGEFIDFDIMGYQYSASEWMDILSVMLTFYTETDLAEATNEFTTSATLPATVTLSSSQGSRPVPFSIKGVSVLALALVLLASAVMLRRAHLHSRRS